VRTRSSVLALAFLAASAATPSPAHAERPAQIDDQRAGTTSFGHTLTRGQTRQLAISATQTVEAVEGRQVPTNTMALEARVQLEVQSVLDGGGAQLSASFSPDTLRIEEGPIPVELAAFLNSVSGTRFSFSVAPNGTFGDRTGQFRREPSRADTGAFIIDALALSWIQFPAEPVAIGDSWLQSVPLTMGLDVPEVQASISVRYTLAGFVLHAGREHALLDATFATVIDGAQTPAGSDIATVIVGRGLGEGYVIYDVVNGRMAEQSIENGLVITYTDGSGARTTETIRQSWMMRDTSYGAAGEGSGVAVAAP
jgi:hypothetical protein